MGFRKLGDDPADVLETAVLKRWADEDLFSQTIKLTENGEPFVFFEGPPTANGRPGIHHVFSRTIKDLICRYQVMRGRSVTRIAGWDTHGLPVEIEVEKQLQLSGKDDIEKFGVAEFNKRCKDSVFTYRSDWENLSERIGYWLDYENAYATYTNSYIETVWWLLKRLHEKDLLFLGHKVLPYCIRCGTVLSSHELALGYAEHKSPSIFVLMKVVEEDDSDTQRHLLVWTTTPWTLPSNVAVAVNPELSYLELEVDGTTVIVEETVAQHRIVPGATSGKVLADFPTTRTYRGSELVGLRYEQLVDAVDVEGKAFVVEAADFVTSDEGTGLVHIAPAYGADDYSLALKRGLAFFKVIDEAGRFANTKWEEINGKTVFEANDIIAARLGESGKLFGRYDPAGHAHTYPFCWRCDSPLIYYAKKSWFVRTTAVKDRMVEFNRGIDWHPPEVGSGRFGEWLDNNIDWAISRDRYWGTPLPVWICEADEDHLVVVGSYDELAGLMGTALPEDFDPHKPYIDEYQFGCPECGANMKRVSEVIDAWFDSGSMPYAQWHYPFENKDKFDRHFPADYICEGIDQTRGWFYSLLAIATTVFDKPAYRHLIVNELVLDTRGRKMSKRLGNSVDPWEVISEYGADAVRLYLLASSQPWLPKRFDRSAIPEVALGFLNRLKNSYGFLALYAEDWTVDKRVTDDKLLPIDHWLLGRLDQLVARVDAAFGNYEVTNGVRAIMNFCDSDLSNWYIRINRNRFWAPGSEADPAALTTLFEALVTICRLLAPAAPFLTDEIHLNLTGKSVHLAGFPTDLGRTVPEFEQTVDAVRRFSSLARAAREKASLRVRQPVASMKVAMSSPVSQENFALFSDLLRKEVNVKKVELVSSDADLVELKAKPNFRTLGKVYGKATPAAAKASELLSAQQLRQLEEGSDVRVESSGEVYHYRPEDIVVERVVKTDWLVQNEGQFVVALDPTLSDELKQEGLARELVNRIQRFRKEAGYDFTTRIELGILVPQDVAVALENFGEYIAGETLAVRIETSTIADPDLVETVEIDGLEVTFSMKRSVGSGN